MGKFRIIFIAISYLLVSCQDLTQNKFVLNGEVDNLNSPHAILSYWHLSEDTSFIVRDTALITNGIFSLTDIVHQPTPATLELGDTVISFYIEPKSVITMSFCKNRGSEIEILGSKSEDERKQLETSLKPYHDELSAVSVQLSDIERQLNHSEIDSLGISDLTRKREGYMKQYKYLSEKIQDIEYEFIDSNPASFICAEILARYISDGRITLDKQKAIFRQLSTEIRKSNTGKFIEEAIQCQENTSPGAIAPDFASEDMNGNIVRLSDFRGKSHILLNFWSSWYIPSREKVPWLKEIFSKYHDKGFEIIGIANENNPDKWKSFIENNEIGSWYHLLNTDYFNSFASKESIQAKYRKARFVMPVYILIDREGKIIGKWEGDSEQIEEELISALAQVFNE